MCVFWRQVASLLTVQEFDVGDEIVCEGDIADALYLLQDGHAQAERASDGHVWCSYQKVGHAQQNSCAPLQSVYGLCVLPPLHHHHHTS